MASTAEGRVFSEEQPTGKFSDETLDALRARSLEKSTMFDASVDGTPTGLVPAPLPAPQGPTQSRPEFLGKGAPVLVLPPEVAPARVPVPEPTAPPAPAVTPPAPSPEPAHARPSPVVRSHRRLTARALARPRRRRVWRHVFKLALLALVVVCQPWWWNVGDLTAHHAPVTIAR